MSEKFDEYRNLILAELVRLSTSVDKLREIASSLAVEIGELRATGAAKAGFWGGLGGAVAAVVLAFVLKEITK